MRGPLALNRLSENPKDTLLYRLKTPKPDGTTHLVFTPLQLLERLARLVPLPDWQAVLAPSATWRPLASTKATSGSGRRARRPPSTAPRRPTSTSARTRSWRSHPLMVSLSNHA